MYALDNPSIIPDNNVSLTAEARVKVNKVAKSLLNESIEKIITSPLKRTMETAKILSKVLDIPITEDDELVERKRPREIIGRHVNDPEVKQILSDIDANYFNLDYRYSTEENFRDLYERCKHVIIRLENIRAEKVLLVSHAETITMLVSVMLFRESLTPQDYLMVRRFFIVGLASPNLLEFNGSIWKMLSWNTRPQ
jgi:broad specificity phosphatase PhoE